VEAGADYIVSGDYHLLRLKRFGGIPILGASEFLAKVNS
jgi:predicted nucleic acid-binding protein